MERFRLFLSQKFQQFRAVFAALMASVRERAGKRGETESEAAFTFEEKFAYKGGCACSHCRLQTVVLLPSATELTLNLGKFALTLMGVEGPFAVGLQAVGLLLAILEARSILLL